MHHISKVDHCAHRDHDHHDHHDEEDGWGYMATMVTPSELCPTNAHKQTDLPIFLSMMLVLMMMMIVMKNSHMATVQNQFINILWWSAFEHFRGLKPPLWPINIPQA